MLRSTDDSVSYHYDISKVLCYSNSKFCESHRGERFAITGAIGALSILATGLGLWGGISAHHMGEKMESVKQVQAQILRNQEDGSELRSKLSKYVEQLAIHEEIYENRTASSIVELQCDLVNTLGTQVSQLAWMTGYYARFLDAAKTAKSGKIDPNFLPLSRLKDLLEKEKGLSMNSQDVELSLIYSTGGFYPVSINYSKFIISGWLVLPIASKRDIIPAYSVYNFNTFNGNYRIKTKRVVAIKERTGMETYSIMDPSCIRKNKISLCQMKRDVDRTERCLHHILTGNPLIPSCIETLGQGEMLNSEEEGGSDTEGSVIQGVRHVFIKGDSSVVVTKKRDGKVRSTRRNCTDLCCLSVHSFTHLRTSGGAIYNGYLKSGSSGDYYLNPVNLSSPITVFSEHTAKVEPLKTYLASKPVWGRKLVSLSPPDWAGYISLGLWILALVIGSIYYSWSYLLSKFQGKLRMENRDEPLNLTDIDLSPTRSTNTYSTRPQGRVQIHRGRFPAILN